MASHSAADIRRHLDIFRPLKRGDYARAVYLYPDHHCVTTWERKTDVGPVKYVQVAQDIGIQMPASLKGRIVFDGPQLLAPMVAAGAYSLSWAPKHLDNGTPNTKEAGTRVGYLNFNTPYGWLYLYEFDGLAPDWTVQDTTEYAETFDAGKTTWGFDRCKVAKMVLRPDATEGKGL